MVYEIKKLLALKLRVIKEANVYTHESKQTTKLPAFFISRVSSSSSGGSMRGRRNVGFDVTYIQKDFDESELDHVETDLMRINEVGSYKLINKMAYQVDDALHFQFDVFFNEVYDDESELMNIIDVKEEMKNA